MSASSGARACDTATGADPTLADRPAPRQAKGLLQRSLQHCACSRAQPDLDAFSAGLCVICLIY